MIINGEIIASHDATRIVNHCVRCDERIPDNARKSGWEGWKARKFRLFAEIWWKHDAAGPEKKLLSFNEPFFTPLLIKTDLSGCGWSNAVCIALGNGPRDAIRTRSSSGLLQITWEGWGSRGDKWHPRDPWFELTFCDSLEDQVSVDDAIIRTDQWSYPRFYRDEVKVLYDASCNVVIQDYWGAEKTGCE